ncbi:MAG: diadenylate cyclase [Candidatus Nanohaloarchaea archaeon]
MKESPELSFDYLEDERVQDWEDRLDFVMETLSSSHSYEGERESHENGPGLLAVQVADDGVEEYAFAMDPNPWDEEDDFPYIDDDIDEVYEMFEEAAYQDGAVIVTGNGRILPTNVMLEPPEFTRDEAETISGMGTKHINAARISVVPDVVYAKTLSSTDGHITTYVDGKQRAPPTERDEVAYRWRDTE